MTTLPSQRPHRCRRLLAALAFLLAGSAVGLRGQEESGPATVIMNDGFVLQGRYFKESELVMEQGGRPVKVAKASGFDVIEDGPRFVVFSTHARKGGKLTREVTRPPLSVYKTKYILIGGGKLPPIAKVLDMSEWDANWKRVMKVSLVDGGWERIEQQIVGIDANQMLVAATRFGWRLAFQTAELDPKLVSKLLSTHPDLKDQSGKADPQRRMNIAQFLKDVGDYDPSRQSVVWYRAARAELEKLKKDAPGPWDKEATERADKLRDDLDRAEFGWAVDELEAAVAAGRYGYAGQIIAGVNPMAADPAETKRFSVLKAQVEMARDGFDKAPRLLADLIDRESGALQARARAAVVGGPAAAGPRPLPSPETAALLEAAAGVLAELHPDTVSRVELFTTQALQAEQRRKEGKDTIDKPDALLALAITGWLKGKNGAEKNVASALRYWSARQMAVAYLREPILNNRRGALAGYLRSGQPLAPEELTQLITLLPPPAPEDPAAPGTPVPKEAAGGQDGLFRRNSGPTPDNANGYDYVLRLPPEYHHGRAYPVVIALTTPGASAEQFVGQLADAADRHGYILAAPDWVGRFDKKGYDFSGKDQPIVAAVLRDLMRRFQVDPDKVFLFGYGEGANFAVDVGMAHPDLFAGVAAVGPNLPMNIYMEYWKNAQKLPMYTVIGEQAGTFNNVRKLYEKWMFNGYPALLTVYKGRGHEWYRSEVPRIFDWMGRKARVRGTGALRLNNPGFEAWQVLRESDDRFYWVGVGDGGLRAGNLAANWANGRQIVPAQFKADLGRGGVVEITNAIGIRKFVIWLERDLIDWNQPVRININGQPARNYVPKKLDPDPHLMFEELFRTGDRKMLYLGKIEVDGPG